MTAGEIRHVSVRLTDRMIGQLDALAEERGVTRTRVIRQLSDAGLARRPLPPGEPPSHEELIAILSERARAGNVSAARSLLAREEERDPRARAVALFAEMVRERQP